MKSVKKFAATFLIVTGLVLLMAEGAYAYLLHTRFELFGHPCDIYMENIRFEGSEITDFRTLESGLRRFPHLKTVDTGSFMMYAEDIPELKTAFPNVDFRYDTWVNIEGADYPVDATEVNLTDHGYTDLGTLISKLAFLPALESVTFGENYITAADKLTLTDRFPGVDFRVVEIYTIGGVDAPANAESIDLTWATIDGSLLEKLSLFPDLKSVDLHGHDLTWDERLEYARRYPKVNFGWDVEFGEEVYDSSEVTEIDLSRKRFSTDDLVTLKELTEQIRGLEKLIVCDCGLDNETLGEFRKEVPDVNVVWRLYMGKWRLRTDQVTFSVLIYNTIMSA